MDAIKLKKKKNTKNFHVQKNQITYCNIKLLLLQRPLPQLSQEIIIFLPIHFLRRGLSFISMAGATSFIFPILFQSQFLSLPQIGYVFCFSDRWITLFFSPFLCVIDNVITIWVASALTIASVDRVSGLVFHVKQNRHLYNSNDKIYQECMTSMIEKRKKSLCCL